MGLGFDYIMWRIFPVIFITVIFALIVGVFVVTAIRGIRTWSRNNHSPRLDVAASVVTKRTSVSRHRNSNDDFTHTSTSYYVTFQFNSGDRQEFHVSGSEYGMLAEGDEGTLSFQGTRFLEFKRG